MSTLTRWRLATPLLLLSLLFLAATLIGAWAYWSLQSTAERAITVLLAVMFATNAGMSISIGTDRSIQDTPWLRIGTIILVFLLGCGMTIARRNL